MEIVIDIEDETPMFAQLVEQVKQAVASGSLLPGTQLPSIRQLANDLDLNSKTVAKAYKLLERDAIIEAKGYRGSFIHPKAKENCTVDFELLATQKLNSVIDELEQEGVTASEIRIVFNRIMSGKK